MFCSPPENIFQQTFLSSFQRLRWFWWISSFWCLKKRKKTHRKNLPTSHHLSCCCCYPWCCRECSLTLKLRSLSQRWFHSVTHVREFIICYQTTRGEMTQRLRYFLFLFTCFSFFSLTFFSNLTAFFIHFSLRLIFFLYFLLDCWKKNFSTTCFSGSLSLLSCSDSNWCLLISLHIVYTLNGAK